MSTLNIIKIYDLLLKNSIFANYIEKNVENLDTRSKIRKFCETYLRTSSTNFSDILEKSMVDSSLSNQYENSGKKSLEDFTLTLNKDGRFYANNTKDSLKSNVRVTFYPRINEEVFLSLLDKSKPEIFDFSLIALMLLKNVVFITIPSGFNSSIPLKFENILNRKFNSSSTYISINVESGSNVRFYQSNQSENCSISANTVYINLEKNTHVEYTNLQDEGDKTISLDFFNSK